MAKAAETISSAETSSSSAETPSEALVSAFSEDGLFQRWFSDHENERWKRPSSENAEKGETLSYLFGGGTVSLLVTPTVFERLAGLEEDLLVTVEQDEDAGDGDSDAFQNETPAGTPTRPSPAGTGGEKDDIFSKIAVSGLGGVDEEFLPPSVASNPGRRRFSLNDLGVDILRSAMSARDVVIELQMASLNQALNSDSAVPAEEPVGAPVEDEEAAEEDLDVEETGVDHNGLNDESDSAVPAPDTIASEGPVADADSSTKINPVETQTQPPQRQPTVAPRWSQPAATDHPPASAPPDTTSARPENPTAPSRKPPSKFSTALLDANSYPPFLRPFILDARTKLRSVLTAFSMFWKELFILLGIVVAALRVKASLGLGECCAKTFAKGEDDWRVEAAAFLMKQREKGLMQHGGVNQMASDLGLWPEEEEDGHGGQHLPHGFGVGEGRASASSSSYPRGGYEDVEDFLRDESRGRGRGGGGTSGGRTSAKMGLLGSVIPDDLPGGGATRSSKGGGLALARGGGMGGLGLGELSLSSNDPGLLGRGPPPIPDWGNLQSWRDARIADARKTTFGRGSLEEFADAREQMEVADAVRVEDHASEVFSADGILKQGPRRGPEFFQTDQHPRPLDASALAELLSAAKDDPQIFSKNTISTFDESDEDRFEDSRSGSANSQISVGGDDAKSLPSSVSSAGQDASRESLGNASDTIGQFSRDFLNEKSRAHARRAAAKSASGTRKLYHPLGGLGLADEDEKDMAAAYENRGSCTVPRGRGSYLLDEHFEDLRGGDSD